MVDVYRQSPGSRMAQFFVSSCPGRTITMSKPDSIVYVIDDDASIRDALKSLVRSVGLHVELFASVPEFLERKPMDVASCLILDVRLPGISGLNFQSQLA